MLVEGRYLGAAQEQATRESANSVPLLFMHSIAAGSLDAEGLTLLYESPDVRTSYPPFFNPHPVQDLQYLQQRAHLPPAAVASTALCKPSWHGLLR